MVGASDVMLIFFPLHHVSEPPVETLDHQRILRLLMIAVRLAFSGGCGRPPPPAGSTPSSRVADGGAPAAGTVSRAGRRARGPVAVPGSGLRQGHGAEELAAGWRPRAAHQLALRRRRPAGLLRPFGGELRRGARRGRAAAALLVRAAPGPAPPAGSRLRPRRPPLDAAQRLREQQRRAGLSRNRVRARRGRRARAQVRHALVRRVSRLRVGLPLRRLVLRGLQGFLQEEHSRTQRLHLPRHQPVHHRQEPPQKLPGLPPAQMLPSGHDEVRREARAPRLPPAAPGAGASPPSGGARRGPERRGLRPAHHGGGAARHLPDGGAEEALHRGRRDDVAHRPGRQGARPHDRLGQEDPGLRGAESVRPDPAAEMLLVGGPHAGPDVAIGRPSREARLLARLQAQQGGGRVRGGHRGDLRHAAGGHGQIPRAQTATGGIRLPQGHDPPQLKRLHEFPADVGTVGQQEEAPAASGPRDRRAGLGHLQERPQRPAADAETGTPHHAPLAHSTRQQQGHGAPVQHEAQEGGAGVRPPAGDAGRRRVRRPPLAAASPPTRDGRRRRAADGRLRPRGGVDVGFGTPGPFFGLRPSRRHRRGNFSERRTGLTEPRLNLLECR